MGQYRIERAVLCEGMANKLPYINHMVVIGPNNGRLLLNEEYSNGVIRSLCKNPSLLDRDMANMALKIGYNNQWCIMRVPHVPKSQVKYSLLAKQLGARVATVDEYKAIKKDLEQLNNISKLVSGNTVRPNIPVTPRRA